MSGYQPKTGAACTCRPGAERDNCPRCEGTGQVIDFRAIRARVNAPLGRTPEKMGRCECKNGDCGGCLQSQEAVSDYDFDCTRDAVRLVTVPCASAINEERGTVTVRFTDVPFCAPCAAFHEQRRASHAAERGAK